MTDREALAAAVEMECWFNGVPGPAWWDARLIERTAARERLAQLPPYPAELVERIALAVGGGVKGINYISSRDVTIAVAVLDALNETP